MHVVITTFRLKDWSEEEYRQLCAEVAPAFADVPGLLAKIFIADAETGTYGGVKLFRERDSAEAFKRSELFASVGAHPHLDEIAVRDFGVLEEPTQVTRGLVSVAV